MFSRSIHHWATTAASGMRFLLTFHRSVHCRRIILRYGCSTSSSISRSLENPREVSSTSIRAYSKTYSSRGIGILQPLQALIRMSAIIGRSCFCRIRRFTFTPTHAHTYTHAHMNTESPFICRGPTRHHTKHETTKRGRRVGCSGGNSAM